MVLLRKSGEDTQLMTDLNVSLATVMVIQTSVNTTKQSMLLV